MFSFFLSIYHDKINSPFFSLNFSIDELENFDVKAYKKFYDVTLSGLFDKQFGALDVFREEEFQQSINSLRTLTYNLIDRKRKKFFETKYEEKSNVKDLFDILVSENDPNTEKPFT